MLAFVIGSLAGVLIGFWLARQPLVAAVFDPYIKMLNALPRVVLAPIFALWLGLGIWSKVALGFTLVFFIVFFNVYQGVKEVSPTVLANARMLGMSERQLLRHVYWPSALSWMFSSLHTSVGFAIVGAVVGEYLGSAAGPRLPDPAGRGRVRRHRRVRRHAGARRLRDRASTAWSPWSRTAAPGLAAGRGGNAHVSLDQPRRQTAGADAGGRKRHDNDQGRARPLRARARLAPRRPSPRPRRRRRKTGHARRRRQAPRSTICR